MGTLVKHLLTLTAALFLFNSCSKESKVNDLPADVIASWINIDGASKKSGDLPLSPNVDAPVILTDRKNVGAVPQSNMFIDFKSDKPVAGVYLKVKGSSSYLDVPMDEIHSYSLRLAENQQVNNGTGKGELSMYARPGQLMGGDTIFNVIIIGMSSNSEPQSFCYEYCAYDEEGNTSNVIVVCVQVQSWGGNSNILNTWKYEGLYSYDENMILVYEYPEPWGGDHWDMCTDFNEYGDVEFDVKVYRSVEFKSDGTFVMDAKNVPLPGQLYVHCDDNTYYNHLKHNISYGKWAIDPSNGQIFYYTTHWEANPHAPPQYQEYFQWMNGQFDWLFYYDYFVLIDFEFPNTNTFNLFYEVWDDPYGDNGRAEYVFKR